MKGTSNDTELNPRHSQGPRPLWGTRDWFQEQLDHTVSDGPLGYFSHHLNPYQRHRHLQLLRMVGDVAHDSINPMILDLGCGTGSFTQQLAGLFPSGRIVGVDFVPDLLIKARKLITNGNFLVGSASMLPFRDASFDLVIASEVLYYLSDSGRGAAVKAIFQLLRPGGLLVFTSRLDDGNKYFSAASALELFSARELWKIQNKQYGYHRIYRLLEKIGRTLIKSGEIMTMPGYDISRHDNPAAHIIWRISRLPGLHRVLGPLMKAPMALSRKLLLSPRLPAYLEAVTKRVMAARGATNIVLIVRKRHDGE